MTGFFSGTASFGSVVLTGSGGTDIFVAKYDAGGAVVWVQKAGGAASEQGRKLAEDTKGKLGDLLKKWK